VPPPARRSAGTVVATASLAGLTAMPGDALYTLTKHAVVGYVRAAAPVLAGDGIRVTAVCPGFADTPLIARAKEQFAGFPLLAADDVAAAIEQVLDRGRPGECWYVQPGREPGPYAFRGVPSAQGAEPPPVGRDQ
jgi:NAD(P)-dependent dehydrogenase (short-subunit alcohol dehydrogenase family)